MATYTQYKKLEKPLSTEKYNIAVANKNNDVIDSELHKLEIKNQSQDNLLATKEALTQHISHVLSSAKSYTDGKIADLIDGAPTTLDTLKEISDALAENETIMEALNSAIGNKANADAVLPLTGGTISGDQTDLLYLENTHEDANAVSFRFKIPGHPQAVMLSVYADGIFEIWDDLNKVSLFKSSVNEISYKGRKILTEDDNIPIEINTISNLLTTEEGHALDATMGKVLKDEINEINSNLGDGEISFSVVDGEPYVKVGADTARPFNIGDGGDYTISFTVSGSSDFIAAYSGRHYSSGRGSVNITLKIKNGELTVTGSTSKNYSGSSINYSDTYGAQALYSSGSFNVSNFKIVKD